MCVCTVNDRKKKSIWMLRIVYIHTFKQLGVCAPQICSVVDDGGRSSERVHMCHGRWRRWQYTPLLTPSFFFSFSFYFLFIISGAIRSLVFPSCRHVALCQAFSIQLSTQTQPHFLNIISLSLSLSCLISLYFTAFLFTYQRRDILSLKVLKSDAGHRVPRVICL